MSKYSAAGKIKLSGPVCQSERMVALARQMGGSYATNRHEGHKHFGKCTRPVWGDGYVDGQHHGMCSLCWHNWCATYGSYRLLSLNSAASAVDIKQMATLETLFIESRTDPRKQAAVPASFLEAMWGDDPLPYFEEEDAA